MTYPFRRGQIYEYLYPLGERSLFLTPRVCHLEILEVGELIRYRDDGRIRTGTAIELQALLDVRRASPLDFAFPDPSWMRWVWVGSAVVVLAAIFTWAVMR